MHGVMNEYLFRVGQGTRARQPQIERKTIFTTRKWMSEKFGVKKFSLAYI